MDRLYEESLLYDFYGELLTKHQKQIFEEAVLNDYSLSEVAEEHGITRQGVHDMLRRTRAALAEYEEKVLNSDEDFSQKHDIPDYDETVNKIYDLESSCRRKDRWRPPCCHPLRGCRHSCCISLLQKAYPYPSFLLFSDYILRPDAAYDHCAAYKRLYYFSTLYDDHQKYNIYLRKTA